MENNNNLDKIGSFLKGQLSKKEEKAFREAFEKDDKLAKEIAIQQLEDDLMERMLATELQAKMKQWRTESSPPSKTGKKLKNWLLFIALGILFFLGYKYIDLKKKPNPSTQEIKKERPNFDEQNAPIASSQKESAPPIAHTTDSRTNPPVATNEGETSKKNQVDFQLLAIANYNDLKPAPFTIQLKSETINEQLSNYEQATRAYDKGDFLEAAKFIEDNGFDEQSKVHYLRGHIFFNLKEFTEAIKEFEFVTQPKNAILPYFQDAQWYLLLSYLAQTPSDTIRFNQYAKGLLKIEHFIYENNVIMLIEKVNTSQ